MLRLLRLLRIMQLGGAREKVWERCLPDQAV